MAGMAKRRGKSTAWLMPMRAVIRASGTRVAVVADLQGEPGRQVEAIMGGRVRPSAWQRRLGPEVSGGVARPGAGRD